MNRLFVILFLFVLGVVPHAVTAGDIVCRPDGTQVELNQCAYEEYNKQNAALNQLYRQKMQSLTPESQAHLKKAQLAWIAFRDATCLYKVGEQTAQSGSIWPMNNLYCLADMTEKRVADMKAYNACKLPEDGCPQ